MACPNIHFILMNLSAFGMDNNNDVFLPTDEPHGPDRMHGRAGVIDYVSRTRCSVLHAAAAEPGPTARWAPALQRTACGLRSVRGTAPLSQISHAAAETARSGIERHPAVKRMPVASASALPSAAATGL